MNKNIVLSKGMIYNKIIEKLRMYLIKLKNMVRVCDCGEENMTYKVMDIARFVINYCNNKGYEISNLKLQKLLYFIQAEYLANYSRTPCFEEDIQAWNFGPVIPEVYHEFKMYGSGNIPRVDSYSICDFENFEFGRKEFDENIICEDDRKRIELALDGLSEYSAATLVNVTHNQKPWNDAYNGEHNQIISKESIRDYFGEN